MGPGHSGSQDQGRKLTAESCPLPGCRADPLSIESPAYPQSMTTSVRIERHSGCFGGRTRFSCVAAPREAVGEARWTGQARLTINRRSRPLAPGSAQVAQLVEHATENRSVGGSIPPLGTIKLQEAFPFKKLSPYSELRLPDCVTRVSNNAISGGASNEARGVAVSSLCAADSRRCAGQIGRPNTPLSSGRDDPRRHDLKPHESRKPYDLDHPPQPDEEPDAAALEVHLGPLVDHLLLAEGIRRVAGCSG
jgi:hypothetical protein